MAEPLRQKLLQNGCSGAFVLLDATVNSKAPEAEYSKTGLYLKRNGYDQNDSELLLYRGIAEVAGAHDMVLHRKWRLEFHTDMFPDYEAIMKTQLLSMQCRGIGPHLVARGCFNGTYSYTDSIFVTVTCGVDT